MLDLLKRPFSLPSLAAATAAAVIVTAAYCVAYTSLAGQPETFSQSVAWAVSNVLPWLIAIEFSKRMNKPAPLLLPLVTASMGSVWLGYLLGVSDGELSFELARRAPFLLVGIACALLLRSGLANASPSSAQIPLFPQQIDWVRAAGNYVELRSGQRTIVCRCSITSAERQLSKHGFVRIHRSYLLRRDWVERVRPSDVILRDGTHLPIGNRYRSALLSEKFVPSSRGAGAP